MEEFGTDSGVLLKTSETCLSEWGQWVRHTVFFFGGVFLTAACCIGNWS